MQKQEFSKSKNYCPHSVHMREENSDKLLCVFCALKIKKRDVLFKKYDSCSHLKQVFNAAERKMVCINCGLMVGKKQLFKDYCKSCPHLNQVEDEREGNIVCVDCGLIMDTSLYSFSKLDNCTNSPLCVISDEEVNCLKNEKDELNTLCDKLHIYEDTKVEIMKFWKLIEKWYKNPQNQSKKYNKQGLIVMAIYQTLNELNMPRPMSHLCQEAGIKELVVWHWMKMYFKNKKKDYEMYFENEKEKDHEVLIDSLQMCEYFLKPLELCYNVIKKIKSEVAKNDMLSFAPKTLITACAYLFLRNNIKNKLSIQKIAKLLGVSVMSVYRCVDALKKKNDV